MAELPRARARAPPATAIPVVLDDVSLSLADGDSLALLGRNGVGKTTLLVTLMGLTTLRSGTLRWRGGDLASLPTFRRARAGLGWVPQERFVFPSLTVEEHLTAVARPGPWDLARVYAIFPRLEERKQNLGNQLSGGEQQMVAIGRALMVNPTLLLLDEPMEGLAPIIVQELMGVIREPDPQQRHGGNRRRAARAPRTVAHPARRRARPRARRARVG